MTQTIPYAQCEKQFFAKLADLGFNPEVIFDVGASNGAWSTTMVEVFPHARYELFEPLAGRFPEYDRVLDWALRTHEGFRLHKTALGAERTEAAFWAESAGVGSSLLVSNVPAEQQIRVPVQRLDDFLADGRCRQPQLIKMDVQGGEAQVIAGGPKTIAAADVLLIETWLRRGYGRSTPLLHEIMDLVKPLGFVLVELGDFYRQPDQELISIDAFFAHRRLIDRLDAPVERLPWRSHWQG
jgi:FkbM family methyltransferase